MTKILDGRKLGNELNDKLKKEVSELKKKIGHPPTLATILVGEDPASKIYVNIKHKTCKKVGINSLMVSLPKNAKKEEISEKITELNDDKNIHGILLQIPLPENSRNHTNELLQEINEKKDVDGFHYINRGKLFYQVEELVPCTPKGIITLLEHNDIKISGKEVTIVNRSNLLGKPLIFLFLNRDATVSVCHTKTRDLNKYTRQADILVVGVGHANFITKEKIKPNAIIIDVGMNRVEGELFGDVDFEDVYEKCSYITPVPGGVGPMTVASLLENTIKAYKHQMGLI
ncbi:MAG: bifunctional methylenetetrahydrofolate dehydrogenase/methenyltetrahydrofolate cyclohydrolase FolD [Promethearchaeati archaeon]